MLKQPSLFDTVFCPHCQTLLLDGATCPTGDWERRERGAELGALVWQRALEGEIGKPYFAPARAGQLLLAGVEKGERRDERFSELVALDAQTGKTEWTHTLAQNRFARFLTVAGKHLISSSEHSGVLAGSHCVVQALDVQTGEAVWQTELPAHSHSAPVLLGSLLLISASDHRVYALHEEDGSIAWQSAALPSWSPAPQARGDNAVFIGGFTHVITGLTGEGKEAPLFLNQSETDWFDIP